FDDTLDAGSMRVGGELALSSDGANKAIFKGVNLTAAKIAGHMTLSGASFDGDLEAVLLQVGGTLSMASSAANKTRFNGVNLTGAKIGGDVSGSGTSFKTVNLIGARIQGEFNMRGASVDGAISASSLEVGGDLSMQSNGDIKTSLKDINLTGAKI